MKNARLSTKKTSITIKYQLYRSFIESHLYYSSILLPIIALKKTKLNTVQRILTTALKRSFNLPINTNNYKLLYAMSCPDFTTLGYRNCIENIKKINKR